MAVLLKLYLEAREAVALDERRVQAVSLPRYKYVRTLAPDVADVIERSGEHEGEEARRKGRSLLIPLVDLCHGIFLCLSLS